MHLNHDDGQLFPMKGGQRRTSRLAEIAKSLRWEDGRNAVPAGVLSAVRRLTISRILGS
jgi:hypothetical protein